MRDRRRTLLTPRYLLRRNLVRHLLRRFEPGRFLEVGCGRGELLPWLARMGYEGIGLDPSPDVHAEARAAAQPYAPRIRVLSDPELLRGERFRYVLAFEVLEHLEDDAAALDRWREWLEPEGRLVLTVPAHMSRWTASDDFVGHCRRYERDDLRRLLQERGYAPEIFWSYGFPLTSWTRPLRAVVYRSRLRRVRGVDREERTLRSALDSTRALPPAARPLGLALEVLGRGFHWLQLPFRETDLGDGYLVSCRLA